MRSREQLIGVSKLGDGWAKDIIFEILLDLRDQNAEIISLLKDRNKRRKVVEEITLTDKEQKLLDTLKDDEGHEK